MMSLFSKEKSLSLVNEDSKDKKLDDKKTTVTVVVPIHKLMSNRLGGFKTKGGFSNSLRKPVKTKLAWSATISSSANTILNSAISIDLLQSSEFASWSALYDLVKCVGGTIFWSVDSTGGTPTDTFAILTYDPDDPSSYNATKDAMIAAQNTGPMRVAISSSTSLTSPQPVDKRGMWTFRWKCPPMPQKISDNSSSSLSNNTGMWTSTNIGSVIKYGYIKPVVEAAGTSVVTSLHYFILVDVEFKSRT